jgi:hypothetical protein
MYFCRSSGCTHSRSAAAATVRRCNFMFNVAPILKLNQVRSDLIVLTPGEAFVLSPIVLFNNEVYPGRVLVGGA